MSNSYTAAHQPGSNQISAPMRSTPPLRWGQLDPGAAPAFLEQRQQSGRVGYALPAFIKNFNGLNLQEWTSVEMAKRIIGNNLRVLVMDGDEKLKEIIRRLDRDNNFMQAGYNLVKTLSVYGMLFVSCDLVDGDVVWGYTYPYQLGAYTNFKNRIVSGTFRTKIATGSAGATMIQEITVTPTSKTTRYFRAAYPDAASQKMELARGIDGNPIEVRAAEHVEYQLRADPILLFKNMPVHNPWETSYADAYPDATFIRSYQAVIDQLWRTLDTELQINITRVYLRLNEQEYEGLLQTNSRVVESFYQSGIIILPSYHNLGDTAMTTWIEVQSGNPQLAVYFDALERIFDMYSTQIGLSTGKDKPTNFRTATGIRFIKSEDTVTCMIRRNFFKQQFKRLIINSVLMTGAPYTAEDLEGKLEVYLHQVIGEDRMAIIAEEKELMALCLSSPVRAMMRLASVSEEAAQDMIVKNCNWAKNLKLSPEQAQQLIAQIQQATTNQGGMSNNQP